MSPALSGRALGRRRDEPPDVAVAWSAAGGYGRSAGVWTDGSPGTETGVNPRADERSSAVVVGPLDRVWAASVCAVGASRDDDRGPASASPGSAPPARPARLAAAGPRRAPAAGAPAAAARRRPLPRRLRPLAASMRRAACSMLRAASALSSNRPRGEARADRGPHPLPGLVQVVGQRVAELGRGLEALVGSFFSARRTIWSSAGGRSAPYLSSRSSRTSRTMSSTSRSSGAVNSRRPISISASTHARPRTGRCARRRAGRRPARATCSRTCP